jgi:hypothetical protein
MPRFFTFLIAFACASCKRDDTRLVDAGATVAASDAGSAPSTFEPASSVSDSDASARPPLERTRTRQPADAPASSSLAALGQISEPPREESGPAVVFAPPRVMGGLLTDFEPALRRMRAGVRACYERFLGEEDEPPSASALSLHLAVMPNGSVKSAKAFDVSKLSASAVDCIVRRAQVATFPPPVGEAAEVIVPIQFHP